MIFAGFKSRWMMPFPRAAGLSETPGQEAEFACRLEAKLRYNDLTTLLMHRDPPFTPPSGYRTQSPDTSFDVERILIEAYRRMSPWEKAQRIAELVQAVDTLALAGIRDRYPEASERECRLRLAALRLDRETMMLAFAWDPAAYGS